MKIKEIIKIMETTGNFTIDVKSYLPFALKTLIVNDMLSSCMGENGRNMKVIDFTQKRFCLDIYVARHYAGIEFDQNEVIDQYDYMKSHHIMGYIYDRIDKEDIAELKEMIDDVLKQEISVNNTVEGVLSKGIQELISKIPESGKIDKWVKAAVKSIKDFDPKKHDKLNELLSFAKGDDIKEGKEIKLKGM